MNASAVQALAYIELGWRPIPIPRGKKMPTIMDWPNLQVSPESVNSYFGEECNIGIVLGDVSGGLVDIDLDSPAAVSLAPIFLPSTQVFGRVSKLRSHFIYVSRYARTEKFQALDGSMLVELRSSGGLQTVFPDSVHPSGEAIEWDADYDMPAPLEIQAEDLRSRVARLAAAALLISVGWTHERAVAFAQNPSAGALIGVEEKGVQRISRWLGLEQQPAPRPRLQSIPSRDAIMRRAREYMARVPGAVEGNGGHQQTWEGALNCIRGFDLDRSEGRAILDDYNTRCEPPWSDKELEHKLDGIMNAHTAGRGWLLEDRAHQRSTSGAKNHPNAGSERVNAPEEAASKSAEPCSDAFPTVTIAAVPDDGPVKWLVQDLWLDQAVGIVGGEPKSYKSFVSAQLAVCVAAGMPMFGEHTTQKGRVLMFNAEDRPSMTRNRVHQMCRSMDIDITALDLHLVDVPMLRLDDVEQREKLDRTVARLKPALVILDPLRDLHGLDENDAQVVSELLAPLRIMQRVHKCAVMIVHHMAKATELARRAGQRLRGSSALHGWIDSALYLTHKDGAIKVETEHRAAPAIDPFAFRVESEERMDGPALWLQVQHADGEPETKSERESAIENQVIAAVGASSEPMTGRDIRKVVKCRQEAIVEAIKRLVTAGVLAAETVIRNKHETPGYRISRRPRGAI